MTPQINPQIVHKHKLSTDSVLHVVSIITNPEMYNSRYRIFRDWVANIESSPNVKLYIVEAAFGDRKHEVTDANNPQHLQLRTTQEIWIKENLINIAVSDLLPSDWKYLAWIDGDVFFRNENWAIDTIHQLQHFAVVQPWQQCLDLGHKGNVMQMYESFGWVHQKGERKQRHAGEPYKYAHTGYAWACTRELWQNMKGKGLLDFCILGSGDSHMAWALIGEVKHSVHGKMHKNYLKNCEEWQQQVMKITGGEVGYTNGVIEHAFHGSKKKRYYRERWQILVDNTFDPDEDLIFSETGLLKLITKPKLNAAIRQYNRSRQEDSIDD